MIILFQLLNIKNWFVRFKEFSNLEIFTILKMSTTEDKQARSALIDTISKFIREKDEPDGHWCLDTFDRCFQCVHCPKCGEYNYRSQRGTYYGESIRCKCIGSTWDYYNMVSYQATNQASWDFYPHFKKMSEVFNELNAKFLKIKKRLDILSKEEKAIAVIRDDLGPDGHNSEGCKVCKITLDSLRGITGYCTFPKVSKYLQWLVAHAHCMSRPTIDAFCEFDLMMYIESQKRFFKHNLSEEAKKHHRHPNGYLDDLSQEVIAISIEFFETLTPNLEDCY